MPFNELSLISKELEENIRTLEYELRDASAFIYQGLNQESERSREGVNLLESLVEKWKTVCNNLDKDNAEEEEEVKMLEEEVEYYDHCYNQLKATQAETETILAEKHLLELSPASLANSTSLNVNGNGDIVTPSPFSLTHGQLQTSTPSNYADENTFYESPK